MSEIGGRRLESQRLPITALTHPLSPGQSPLITGGAIALPEGTRGLLVETAGRQSLRVNGDDWALVPLPAGITWIYATHLLVNAGNTASNIWALI